MTRLTSAGTPLSVSGIRLCATGCHPEPGRQFIGE
jgi:hypothetical protein